MKKSDISALMRQYVRDHLSPTDTERDFVSSVYESVQKVLGTANCLQIGSYPRFTSVSPLHDLDVLYILGNWQASADPSDALDKLQTTLERDYENVTEYSVEISRQTHSITLLFSDDANEEIFSVDIVPAYISGKNSFGDDVYVVPEIAAKSRSDRKRIADEVAKGKYLMAWIKSDPRGYIAVATRANSANDDFRKSIKLVKGWRGLCKELDEDFPLKSFHAEQAVTRYFLKDSRLDIYDAVMQFFVDLPQLMQQPQIPDRADKSRYIDGYVSGLPETEKNKVLTEGKKTLTKLKDFSEGSTIEDLLHPNKQLRIPNTTARSLTVVINGLQLADFSHKQELEDVNILATDSMSTVKIEANLYWGRSDTPAINRRHQGSFSSKTEIPKYHWLKYYAITTYDRPHEVYWQVVNTGAHAEREFGLRGQIELGRTEKWERSLYTGVHWVECFIVDKQTNKCVGRSGPFYVGFRDGVEQ
jgi:hypothetical protein